MHLCIKVGRWQPNGLLNPPDKRESKPPALGGAWTSTGSLHVNPEKWDGVHAIEFSHMNFQIFDSEKPREVTVRVTSNFNPYAAAFP